LNSITTIETFFAKTGRKKACQTLAQQENAGHGQEAQTGNPELNGKIPT
jgi:hypothetical protein